MKTESNKVQRWDDIIFENRNKEYGAYTIRKNYNDNVLRAEVISIGIGLLIFIAPTLLRDEQIAIPTIPDLKDPIVLDKYDNIKPIEPPQKQRILPPLKRTDVIPTHVTTDDVVEKPADPTPPDQNLAGTLTGTDNSGNEPAVESGTGDAPIIDTAPAVFTFVEKMPTYEGGDEAMMKFIQKKLRYPLAAIRKKDEGTVFVSFVISAEGNVVNVEVIRGIGKECDAEAVRVISMMDRWKPVIQNNMAVPVKKILPITFKLEKL